MFALHVVLVVISIEAVYVCIACCVSGYIYREANG